MTFKNAATKICTLFIGLSLFTGAYAGDTTNSDALFSFGLIADCQYHAVEGSGTRKYSISDKKLRQCVEHFNKMDLEFVIHLGDFIDKDFDSFDVVVPIYAQLFAPRYHVLGNHDFSVAEDKKADVPQKMGMPARYYDFSVKGWRFVVLDGNDVSFHAYAENSHDYKYAAEYYDVNKIDSPKWNGAIGEEQLDWLKSVMQKACKAKESVVLFCHFPLYPENNHNLWNADEVISVIEKFSCVKAYINGHNHAGNYGAKNDIHYLTVQGMVDTEQISYGVVLVEKDRLQFVGYGREQNRRMEILN